MTVFRLFRRLFAAAVLLAVCVPILIDCLKGLNK
jgi:hypothetical protein